MRQFCIISGVITQHDTLLDNLGLKKRKLTKHSKHMVFNYPLVDLLTMVAFKPIENLTTEQRHLLAVALLVKTGVVTVDYPILPTMLDPDKLLSVYPILIECLIRIACTSKYWDTLLPAQPRIHIRKENKDDINIIGFIKNVLYVQTNNLLLSPSLHSRRSKSELELIDSEISFEQELKRQLSTHSHKRHSNHYTVTMGKHVLKLLSRELGKTHLGILSPEYVDQALYILTTNPEKLSVHRASYRDVERLRKLILTHVKISIAPEDTTNRAYTAIVIRHLDSKLDYFNTVAAMFGAITIDAPAKLDPAYPIEYTVKELTSTPFDNATIIIPPKNPNVKNSKSKLIAAFRLKKARALEDQALREVADNE